MNLEKFKVPSGGKEHFIKKFKSLMGADVKSIVCIDTLMSNVEPSGDLPVGFVYMEGANFYLVGWTDSKKRCHPFNLYPYKKKPVKMYDSWMKREWTFCDLYKCVFQRIRQLEDPPTAISSINNWEDNRQALYTCSCLVGDEVLKKVKVYELKLIDSITNNNSELLKSMCEELGLEISVEALKQQVKKQYECKIDFSNKEKFVESGILNLLKDATSKWNI